MTKKVTNAVATAVLIAISVCYIVLQIISLVGCRKAPAPQQTNADKAAAMQTISATVKFTCDIPTVEDGILVFKDAKHYRCYYDFLTNAINSDTSGRDLTASYCTSKWNWVIIP